MSESAVAMSERFVEYQCAIDDVEEEYPGNLRLLDSEGGRILVSFPLDSSNSPLYNEAYDRNEWRSKWRSVDAPASLFGQHHRAWYNATQLLFSACWQTRYRNWSAVRLKLAAIDFFTEALKIYPNAILRHVKEDSDSDQIIAF